MPVDSALVSDRSIGAPGAIAERPDDQTNTTASRPNPGRAKKTQNTVMKINHLLKALTAALLQSTRLSRTRAASFLALIAALTLAAALPLKAGVIATSSTEFSGVQSQNGWTYGYREVPAEGASENYDPERDFIPFTGGDSRGDWNGTTQQWNSTGWKTIDGSEVSGPGARSGSSTRWLMRRWQAAELTEKGPVSLRWTLAKQDVTCGNGVTGALFINGQLADKTTIAFDRAATVTRTYYALLCPNDRVDLVLRPLGTDGTDDAQCDGTLTTLIVNTTIVPGPKQPDGKFFVSSLTTPRFQILSQTHSAADRRTSLTWRSQAWATYGIEASSDLVSWGKIQTGLAGGPTTTSWSEGIPESAQAGRFYRVAQEAKTIEGLWVARYVSDVSGGTLEELVRVKLTGDQVVATKLIGDNYVTAGNITWEASLTTGAAQAQFAHLGFVDPSWIPASLKINSPDRITITIPSENIVQPFRRVD